jgi:prepilin-type N-terminal cleavage/methylation domain-containing protein
MKMYLDLLAKRKTYQESFSGDTPLKPVPCPLSPEKGFTLLELILSIGILSIVLVTIYAALSMGSRTWEKGERDIETIQRERVVMNLLSREIKSAFPYKVTPSELDDHKEFYAFDGKKDSISFVSGVPLRGERGGLSWLTFWVEEDLGLVVIERDALRADIFEERDSLDKEEMEVLDQRVTDIQFEYYQRKSGKTEGEGEGEWEEKWDAEKEGTLPHAVKVVLTLEEEERPEESEAEPYPRELVIPLMVHVDTIRGRRRTGGVEPASDLASGSALERSAVGSISGSGSSRSGRSSRGGTSSSSSRGRTSSSRSGSNSRGGTTNRSTFK